MDAKRIKTICAAGAFSLAATLIRDGMTGCAASPTRNTGSKGELKC